MSALPRRSMFSLRADHHSLRDKSLTNLDNLPEPEGLAEDINENSEVGLNGCREVDAGLEKAL